MLKNSFVASRGYGKTGLEFFHLLEQLKRDSNKEEDKIYFEQKQKEWSEFCVGLTLRSFGG